MFYSVSFGTNFMWLASLLVVPVNIIVYRDIFCWDLFFSAYSILQPHPHGSACMFCGIPAIQKKMT
jgi:hypothetical protein